ncbi:MAG: hypothetical protein FJY65_06835 [Calditrichaeota bacterium]|nr:hypothetical protein [Calditrichota bacterium]
MLKKTKAIALLSGGLDSSLALLLMHRQGVEIQAVKFYTGFSPAKFQNLIEIEHPARPNYAQELTTLLSIPLTTIDISSDYMSLLHNPEFGYGKNVNPCIDCRIKMLHKARRMMTDCEAEFVFTGEVLGQRPMSQHLPQLRLIEEQSGLNGRLLRPLSAQLLPMTLPERENLIDRQQLKGFSGRTRKPQAALAAELGLADYAQPAGGGCLLTDPNYAVKVIDLWHYRAKIKLDWNDYDLLMVGRHFRLNANTKVIVGRNKNDNTILDHIRSNRTRLEVEHFAGPVTLIDGTATTDDIAFAAQLTARYSDGRNTGTTLTVRIENDADIQHLQVEPLSSEMSRKYQIL